MDTIKLENKGKTKLIAHRGLSGLETENTVAAFVAACNRDYFGVETDVHVTADGKFAIYHDDETGRVCEENLPVERSSFAQIRALSMREAGGEGFSDVQRIPALSEYLNVIRRYGKRAVVELKNPMTEENIEEIVRTCARLYDLESVVFISFCFDNLVVVRKNHPHCTLQFLTGEYSEELPAKLAAAGMGVDIWYGALTEARVRAFHEAGVPVNCWTCDAPAEAEKLISWGVDMLTTNILQ